MKETMARPTENKSYAGSKDISYELGKRRADMVNRYLVTQKNLIRYAW
jgi:hypothetical protein